MVAAICALHEKLDPARFAMLPDVLTRYEQWLPIRARDPRSVFLLAEIDKKPVGFLVGQVEENIPIYRLHQYGFIHDLWVDPAHRKGGIARALVRAAASRFISIGVAQIRLETAIDNEPARKLFESCGFRASTTELLAELAP